MLNTGLISISFLQIWVEYRELTSAGPMRRVCMKLKCFSPLWTCTHC